MIVVHKVNCAVLIPKWEAKSWWTLVINSVSGLCPVSSEHIEYNGNPCDHFPSWEFVLAIFNTPV